MPITHKCIPVSRPISQISDLCMCFSTWPLHFDVEECSHMYMFKIKLLISTPHPSPHYFPSKWHHYPPNHKSSGIRLQSMSGSIHFLFLYVTTICCSSHHHLLPRLFISLPSACHLSVVIITFSNLTQIIAHHYLKCSSGFQFPIK